jgi:hypothetical protein
MADVGASAMISCPYCELQFESDPRGLADKIFHEFVSHGDVSERD